MNNLPVADLASDTWQGLCFRALRTWEAVVLHAAVVSCRMVLNSVNYFY